MLRVSAKSYPLLTLLACFVSGCTEANPGFQDIASSQTASLSSDLPFYEVENKTATISVTGTCTVQAGALVSVLHKESAYRFPDVPCIGGVFLTTIDAVYLGFSVSGDQATLVLSTPGTSDVPVTVTYNYCSITRQANSPFANSQEPGIDGLNAASAFSICTAAQFAQISQSPAHLSKSFQLMADLDLDPAGGYVHVPIGNTTTQFLGRFSGNGRIVRNLSFDNSAASNVGLFGYVGANALIEHVRVVDAAVSGAGSVGILAGYNKGKVSRSMSSGSVSGNNLWVGGLVGSNNPGGIIEDSYSTAAVFNSNRMLGGLAGLNSSATIRRCYAAGNVSSSGDGYQGNLVGYSVNTGNTVENSFAIGDMINTHSAPWPNSIGFLIGWASVTTLTNDHYSGTCTANIACGAKGTPQLLDSFQSPLNAPLNTWDFVTVWKEVPGALPDLQ